MKKFLSNLSLFNILGYFSIASITFLLGFSFQNKGFIKGKLKQIYLQSKYKEIQGPKKVVCPQNSFVIAYFGQSNSAGYVKPHSKKLSRIILFSLIGEMVFVINIKNHFLVQREGGEIL